MYCIVGKEEVISVIFLLRHSKLAAKIWKMVFGNFITTTLQFFSTWAGRTVAKWQMGSQKSFASVAVSFVYAVEKTIVPSLFWLSQKCAANASNSKFLESSSAWFWPKMWHCFLWRKSQVVSRIFTFWWRTTAMHISQVEVGPKIKSTLFSGPGTNVLVRPFLSRGIMTDK